MPLLMTLRRVVLGTGAAALAVWGFLGSSAATEQAVQLPAPTLDAAPSLQSPQAATAATATAIFAGGCFWGVQAVFQHTQGVLHAVSGYAGGASETASYARIGSGRTGHAEAVQITYDPKLISYGKLLQIYFSVAHDPTQLNRQGPDAGTQYRSAVFYVDAGQKQIAERYIAQLGVAKLFPRKIVTQLTPLAAPLAFYRAEDNHQDYATRNPHSPYIVRFDQPKIAALKTLMPELYRAQPVLVSQSGS